MEPTHRLVRKLDGSVCHAWGAKNIDGKIYYNTLDSWECEDDFRKIEVRVGGKYILLIGQ